MDPFHDPMDEQQPEDGDIFADGGDAQPQQQDGGFDDVFGAPQEKTASEEHETEAAPAEEEHHADNAGSDDPFAEPYDDSGAAPAAVTVSSPSEEQPADEDTKYDDGGLPDLDTPLAKWERERKIVLAKRIADAQAAKTEARAKAKQDIADFNKQRAEVLQKTQSSNRLEEKNHKADMESLMKHGTEWEKVAKLVNLQAKSNEARNVDRLRKLLIQLKNDKDTKPSSASK